ncbi:MAG: glycosyl hydrolase, partial [Bacteroidota bacterium]|nr:glycosyl hydrolase [Bacteroidota bacterium]
GTLVVGSDDGYIHVSSDSGASWHRISDNLPQELWVSRVQFSKHIPSRIYATLNGYRWDDFTPYVYVSDDLGQTWRSLAKGLPLSPVNVVREDHTNADILYVGTDNGFFVSIDGGEAWHMFDADFPRVAVHDLFIQERDNDLLVGTHGRSIYQLELEPIQALESLSQQQVSVVQT